MEKVIVIDGKKVKFKSTAGTARRYRERFGADLFDDMTLLTTAAVDVVEGKKQFSAEDLEVFEDVAYTMAKQADNSIPDDPDEWLDGFETMSVYQVLPDIVNLWLSSSKTTSSSKTESRQTERAMNVALFLLRCVEIGLSMSDLDSLDVGMVLDMFIEKGNDSYEWAELATADDVRKF